MAVGNIERKKNAGNQHYLLLQQYFLSFETQI